MSLNEAIIEAEIINCTVNIVQFHCIAKPIIIFQVMEGAQFTYKVVKPIAQ